MFFKILFVHESSLDNQIHLTSSNRVQCQNDLCVKERLPSQAIMSFSPLNCDVTYYSKKVIKKVCYESKEN